MYPRERRFRAGDFGNPRAGTCASTLVIAGRSALLRASVGALGFGERSLFHVSKGKSVLFSCLLRRSDGNGVILQSTN